MFQIEDDTNLVGIRAEAAISHLATLYACDSGEDLEPDETALRAALVRAARRRAGDQSR